MKGGSPSFAPVEVSAVVLYALAETHLTHHLQVIVGSLLQPLRFKRRKLRQAIVELISNVLQGALLLLLRHHVLPRRIQRDAVNRGFDVACYRVDFLDFPYNVAASAQPEECRSRKSGMTSMTSPRTRNLPGSNTISLRSYCISTRALISRCRVIGLPTCRLSRQCSENPLGYLSCRCSLC